MHLRIVTGQAQPGQADTLAARWRDYFGAQLQSMAGFRHAHFAVDRATNTVVGVSLWDTEPDQARLQEHLDAFRAQAQDLVAGPPQPAVYEVLVEV